jgi:hypothetical protein
MVLLLFSCTPPPNEVVRTYSSFENFLLRTDNVDVEFVKDSIEYVKFYGNFNDNETNYLELIPNDQSIYHPNLLGVRAYVFSPATVTKVEIHYQSLRTIRFYYTPPINLAVTAHYNLYSREPILADSIDLWLRDKQDSTIDVNTTFLRISGGLIQSKVSGHANKLMADFQVYENGSNSRYNFGELMTDSCFLHMYSYTTHNLYSRTDVYANDYLEIDVQEVIGSPADCPACVFEVYYKGHPTIVNPCSSDPRIVVIDNN